MAARNRISARHFGSDLAAAKEAALDGVELCVGQAADTLEIAGPAWRQQVKAAMQATGLAVSSLSLDLLNGHPVATDPRGPEWIEQAVEAAADLGAAGILVPFFGAASRLEQDGSLRMDHVEALAKVMRTVAPQAEEAGVMLGLENTCSATQNLEILEYIGCGSVGCYYDIGNATHAGYDAAEEIRELGGAVCLIHFKDGGDYLGQGKVDMDAVAASLKAIGYDGWIVLETACPSGDRIADCRRNAEFARRLIA